MSEFMGQASTITNLQDAIALEILKIIVADGDTWEPLVAAELAYRYASAMIEARNSQNGNP